LPGVEEVSSTPFFSGSGVAEVMVGSFGAVAEEDCRGLREGGGSGVERALEIGFGGVGTSP